jgi:hypothetical protein
VLPTERTRLAQEALFLLRELVKSPQPSLREHTARACVRCLLASLARARPAGAASLDVLVSECEAQQALASTYCKVTEWVAWPQHPELYASRHALPGEAGAAKAL